MQVIQSERIELSPWAEDHDALTTPARGALPAFDQFDELANGQTVRANRVPRVPAPQVSLFRRLYSRTKARYLNWQLRSMRARLDVLEADMDEALQLAIDQARRHLHSPGLQARRRTLRDEHQALATEWLRVRAEIDNLERVL
ncbi:MAG: hypothetical protein SHS37scaffold296_32 [Burkholderiales phage 68_11]|jgi:hypothetical protein|nr:MAG: hypothetical protein SHS37scaffold296_32 [Burkholderiales phage 68_11]